MKLQFAHRQALAAACLGFAGLTAHAVPVTFNCASNNSGQCPAVAAQVLLDVVDLGGGQATFTFSNSGPIGSTITDIYWRSTAVSGGGAIVDSGAGVSFSWGANPNNPGGGIHWDAHVGADSNAPVGPNGVDPSQWVSFTMAYAGGFGDLVSSLGGDGQLAIHLQRIGPRDESDWAVSTPIPEPGSYALTLAGLAVVGFIARRRRVI